MVNATLKRTGIAKASLRARALRNPPFDASATIAPYRTTRASVDTTYSAVIVLSDDVAASGQSARSSAYTAAYRAPLATPIVTTARVASNSGKLKRRTLINDVVRSVPCGRATAVPATGPDPRWTE